ncbi:ATP-binding protein [Streptomyces sulfonofaciens]|uniref:ATP-binding protein n=1 Tax=Streptomyces sulfonofaciens TaxID=68272 RepID=A0A919FMY4_9ACTN|nr:ATP-binding protein [Streptomyces sulfonofaciens]GHH68926.1 ATP-binding protein [Streptomyces sulfonofaciens]
MQVLQLQLEVRPDPAEVGRARRWARARLARSGIGADEPIAETLILIVSELVTNAVVHTGCPAVLRILLRGSPAGAPEAPCGPEQCCGPDGRGRPAGRAPEGPARPGPPAAGDQTAHEPRRAPETVVRTVRVEVADSSGRPPRPRHADGDETGGRGLELVDGLADRWGWEPSGAGKRVWCELDRFTAPTAAQPAVYRTLPAYEGVAAYEAV